VSTAEHKPYKTLIEGTLVQLTAFSVGGRDSHARVDSPVARDGDGRLTLRGSGIAGAFIASARRLAGGEVQPAVSAGTPSEQAEARKKAKQDKQPELRLTESLWRFHTSHPEPPQNPAQEVRAGVGIRQDTGAAADGLKYEVETIPAGTRWPFLLEVDDYRDTAGSAAALALHVIEDWREVCLLGRNVARGLGWMQLQGVQVIRLAAADALRWPDASQSPRKAFAALANETGRLLDATQLDEIRNALPTAPRPRLMGTGTVRIHAAPGESDWGLDTLSLGGSEAMRSLQEAALSDIADAHPGGADDFDPDLVLAWTKPIDAERPEPFIPGSGLRGPMRHQLSWWLRSREGETVHDPNTTAGRKALAKQERDARDPIEQLFGTGPHAGALLIADATLTEPWSDDAVLPLEQHAEDEFTGGTFAEAKFNRLALVRGTFRFRFLIEADDPKQLAEFRRLLSILNDLGQARQMPIGGANWRGHGWVRWELKLPAEDIEPGAEATQAATAEDAP
jgi:CRISPR/Cas system CSM-associated protein Csm3 (group 7 of RAMP superfamily)